MLMLHNSLPLLRTQAVMAVFRVTDIANRVVKRSRVKEEDRIAPKREATPKVKGAKNYQTACRSRLLHLTTNPVRREEPIYNLT